MSGRHRTIVGGLILFGLVTFALLLAFAARSCPVETLSQPCPQAARNVVVVVLLAAIGTAALVAPFAFLGEVLARRRIVYLGAWSRAGRRGVLAGLVVATLGGLRLAGVLSVEIAIFMLIVAVAAEWLLSRRDG